MVELCQEINKGFIEANWSDLIHGYVSMVTQPSNADRLKQSGAIDGVIQDGTIDFKEFHQDLGLNLSLWYDLFTTESRGYLPQLYPHTDVDFVRNRFSERRIPSFVMTNGMRVTYTPDSVDKELFIEALEKYCNI